MNKWQIAVQDFKDMFPHGVEHPPAAIALFELGDEMYDALAELVALKEIKDVLGKTTEYAKRQPIAWNIAKKIINT